MTGRRLKRVANNRTPLRRPRSAAEARLPSDARRRKESGNFLIAEGHQSARAGTSACSDNARTPRACSWKRVFVAQHANRVGKRDYMYYMTASAERPAPWRGSTAPSFGIHVPDRWPATSRQALKRIHHPYSVLSFLLLFITYTPSLFRPSEACNTSRWRYIPLEPRATHTVSRCGGQIWPRL